MPLLFPRMLNICMPAACDSSLTNIVITNNSKQGPVEWLLPVTDFDNFAFDEVLQHGGIDTRADYDNSYR